MLVGGVLAVVAGGVAVMPAVVGIVVVGGVSRASVTMPAPAPEVDSS